MDQDSQQLDLGQTEDGESTVATTEALNHLASPTEVLYEKIAAMCKSRPSKI